MKIFSGQFDVPPNLRAFSVLLQGWKLCRVELCGTIRNSKQGFFRTETFREKEEVWPCSFPAVKACFGWHPVLRGSAKKSVLLGNLPGDNQVSLRWSYPSQSGNFEGTILGL